MPLTRVSNGNITTDASGYATFTVPNYVAGYTWNGILQFSTSSTAGNQILSTTTNTIKVIVYGEGGNPLLNYNSWYSILWIGVKQ